MSHKCVGWHSAVYTPDQCRECWRAHNPATKKPAQWVRASTPKDLGDPVSRRTNSLIPLPTVVSTAPCIHLGEVLRNQSCGCKEKLRECAVYGTCTTGVRRAGVKCCEGCDGYCSLDYYDTCRRHLIYYVLPVKGDEWKWNCDRILSYLHLFNGRRVVAVGTDSRRYELDTVEEVSRYLGPTFDVIKTPQRKTLGEVLAFPDLAKRVRDSSGYTFYAHAKGVTRGGSTREWTDLMYRANLDNWDRVQESLRHHSITGAFKIPWNEGLWFYSGTFFWVRNEALKSVNVPQFYGGVEHWPCRQLGSGGCIFMEYPVQAQMYDPEVVAHAKECYERGEMNTHTERLDKLDAEVKRVKTLTAPECDGTGIITLTDPVYEPSTYVQIMRLRAMGSTLPITVYHRGDIKRVPGVKYICIDDWPIDFSYPRWYWAIKPTLILNSGLRHCMFIDADAYPIRNPDDLMGSTKIWGEAVPGIPNWKPHVFGLPPSDMAPNSGAMVWDVLDGYQVLELWKYLNKSAGYWFPLTYSDQETLQAAIIKLGYAHTRFSRCDHLGGIGCYLHGDYFAHRIVPKLKSNEEPIAVPRLPYDNEVMKEYREWQSMTR